MLGIFRSFDNSPLDRYFKCDNRMTREDFMYEGAYKNRRVLSWQEFASGQDYCSEDSSLSFDTVQPGLLERSNRDIQSWRLRRLRIRVRLRFRLSSQAERTSK